MEDWRLCLALVVFRIANALAVCTYFNPDEYWQGPEIAHKLAFGYGHLTWEWQPDAMLRSYCHPMLLAALYRALAMVGADSQWMVLHAPRIFHGAAFGVADFCVNRLALRLFDRPSARWALGLQLLNWFNFYSGVRTFSNSLEAVLTTAALSLWPLRSEITGRPTDGAYPRAALALAAAAALIRPTAVVQWTFFGNGPGKLRLVQQVLLIGSVAIGVGLVVDRLGYGVWTMPAVNFYRANVSGGVSELYGVHPWHWYWTEGFTAMLGTMLPYTVAGVAYSRNKLVPLVCALTIGVYSTAAHKEFRFLHPLLPMALVYAGYGANCLWSSAAGIFRWTRRPLASLVLVSNLLLPLSLLCGSWHQQGPVAATDLLASSASLAAASSERTTQMSIDFWTPCHATPYYSQIHSHIDMWFPDCSPDGRLSVRGSESDRFSESPLEFLRSRYENHTMPTHVVLFENVLARVRPLLQLYEFEQDARVFHQHFSGDRDDPESNEFLFIYKRTASSSKVGA